MKYGIEEGQRYIRADGARGVLTVIDTKTFAHCDDVVVTDESGDERRIDAFKLAMVRYSIEESWQSGEQSMGVQVR